MRSRINIGAAEFETFLVVAELGSFSKAAEHLALSQPSISNRVQRLETAVRTKLFERTTRAVILTPAGEALRQRAAPIIRAFQELIDEFCQESETRGQSVVVATTMTLGTLLMPPIIRAFIQANPSITVELQDQVTGDLASDIRSGRVDFAVLAEAGPIEGVDFATVVRDRFVAIGPRDHPAFATGRLGAATLASEPLLILQAYKSVQENLAELAKVSGLALKWGQPVRNVTTLLGMVSEGLALSVLPRLVVRMTFGQDAPGLALAEIDGISETRDFGIASLGHDRMSPAARLLASAIRGSLLSLASEDGP